MCVGWLGFTKPLFISLQLPKNGLDSLPNAHFKQRMVRIHSLVTTGGGCMECDQCHKSESNPTACCSTCGLICSHCLESHRVMKNLFHHKTSPLQGVKEDYLIESLKSADDNNAMRCEKHSNEQLRMYCKTCRKLICSTCMLEGHKPPSHDVAEVASSARAKREELKTSVTAAKNTQTALTEKIESAKHTHQELAEQQEVLKKTIKSNFQLLQEQLDKLQAKSLDAIDSTYGDQLTKALEKVESLTAQAEAACHVVKMGEQALAQTSDLELLTLKWYMSIRLKEVSTKKMSLSVKEGVTVDRPTVLSADLMQLVLGHIQHNMTPSIEASHASGPGVERVLVGKKTSFLVHSLTDVGDPCFEKQSLQIEIKVARTQEKIPFEVFPGKKIGTYNVQYIPIMKGEHVITIRIEGNEINRSPYSVIARGPIDPWQVTLLIDRQEWVWGVACDRNREIYATRNYHHMIVVFNREGKFLRKIGVKGQNLGGLWHPTGIAVDREGNIFVADGKENGRLQKFTKNGQPLAVYSNLRNPQGVLLNKQQDRVYVCDRGHQAVVMLDTNLEEKRIFGELDHYSQSDGFESISGHLVAPHSITESENGSIFVSDMHNVHIFNSNGDHLRNIDYLTGEFSPGGITIDGDLLYVCDMKKNCLLVFTTDGDFVDTKGRHGKQPGQFNTPTSLTVDYDGYLYVTDFSNQRVQVF